MTYATEYGHTVNKPLWNFVYSPSKRYKGPVIAMYTP